MLFISKRTAEPKVRQKRQKPAFRVHAHRTLFFYLENRFYWAPTLAVSRLFFVSDNSEWKGPPARYCANTRCKLRGRDRIFQVPVD